MKNNDILKCVSYKYHYVNFKNSNKMLLQYELLHKSRYIN